MQDENPVKPLEVVEESDDLPSLVFFPFFEFTQVVEVSYEKVAAVFPFENVKVLILTGAIHKEYRREGTILFQHGFDVTVNKERGRFLILIGAALIVTFKSRLTKVRVNLRLDVTSVRGDFVPLSAAVTLRHTAGVFLVLAFLVRSTTARTGLEFLTCLLDVMFGKTTVPKGETIANGAEDVGFGFGFFVGTVFSPATETHSTLTGMMTGVVHIEGFVA